jgi:hypothetical protein
MLKNIINTSFTFRVYTFNFSEMNFKELLILAWFQISFILIVSATKGSYFEVFDQRDLIVNPNKMDLVASVLGIKSKLQCMNKCSRYANCTSVVFTKSSAQCDLYYIFPPFSASDLMSDSTKITLRRKCKLSIYFPRL